MVVAHSALAEDLIEEATVVVQDMEARVVLLLLEAKVAMEVLEMVPLYCRCQSGQAQFAFCAGVAGNWEEADVRVDEQRRRLETCPFVQGVYGGNFPVKTSVLTGGYKICEPWMGSWSYSQNYIQFRH
ncbi:uncharacterized protein LOC136038918 isoform X2 [Artemia franciscana]|uniref:uncharacterized protein LOC136038918 isoform X2 n=1 Tax=Artemia franciscana TaxID=6661 RepID=UPI0032DA132C